MQKIIHTTHRGSPSYWRRFTLTSLAFIFSVLFSLQIFAKPSSSANTNIEAEPAKNKQALHAFSVNENTSDSLTAHLKFYEDTAGNMLLEDILKEPFFTLDKSPNLGFTNSVWWVRAHLKNTSNKGQEYIIKQDYPLIDHLNFYYSQDESWVEFITGDRENFDQRPLQHRTFLFNIYLNSLEEKTVYFRFESQGSMNIALSIHTPDRLIESISTEQLAFGIYYGGFIVLIIYNFFIFLVVRERIFIFYTLYVLSLGAFLSIHNSVSFQYIFPNSPNLLNSLLLFFLASSFFWVLKFTRSILVTPKDFPLLDKIASIFEYIMMLSWFLIPILSFQILIVPLGFLTVLISAHMLVMGIFSVASGHAPARYYLLAWGALLSGVLIYMMKSFGYIPYNAFTQNAMQIGSMIEMILLSLVLSQRVDAIKQSSSIDSLSGLFNRRHFDETFARFFSEDKAPDRPLSVIIFDIDHFKIFNDKHGHGEGDRAIRAVGRLLSNGTRKPGTAFRYGGEEFVVLLPRTDNAAAMSFAERIRVQVQAETSLPDTISVSAGVATCTTGDFSSPELLFNAADIALYKAKKSGRNKVKNFDSEITERRGDPTFKNLSIEDS